MGTTNGTLKASIVLVTERDGKRVELEVIRSGKKVTTLKNISCGYESRPYYVGTESLFNAIEKGFYKIII